MSIQLRNLIKITDTTEKYGVSSSEILFDALEGKLSLFAISNMDIRERLIPCIDGGFHEGTTVGEYIHQFDPQFKDSEYIEIQLGQILPIYEKQIKALIVNQKFSEVELYRPLATGKEGLVLDYWKSEREVFGFEGGFLPYPAIELEDVHVLEQGLVSISSDKEKTTSTGNISTENASSTALKVIGLLMHQLAKSPKYASGTSPNKSQIKELLLDLAEELGINPYGLSKVDERVLADALKYLETQKV
jgi:hypothetical protein